MGTSGMCQRLNKKAMKMVQPPKPYTINLTASGVCFLTEIHPFIKLSIIYIYYQLVLMPLNWC